MFFENEYSKKDLIMDEIIDDFVINLQYSSDESDNNFFGYNDDKNFR